MNSIKFTSKVERNLLLKSKTSRRFSIVSNRWLISAESHVLLKLLSLVLLLGMFPVVSQPSSQPTSQPSYQPTGTAENSVINLVANSGAETCTKQNWTGSGTYNTHGWSLEGNLPYVNSGVCSFFTQSSNALLAQNVSLVVGTTYAVSFYVMGVFGCGGGSNNELVLYVDGATVESLTSLFNSPTFTQYHTSFTASRTVSTLQFSSGGTNCQIFLDDVLVAAVDTSNKVVNPSAELGVSGWTNLLIESGSNYDTHWVVDASSFTQSGSNVFFMQSASTVCMNQSLVLSQFATYSVAFWTLIPLSTCTISVDIGNMEVKSVTDFLTSYAYYSTNFIVSMSTSTLQFCGSGGRILIDDIAVTVVPNIVHNGGAERGLIGWTTTGTTSVDGWIIYGAGAHSGTYGFLSQSSTSVFMNQSLQLSVGTTYSVSCWAKVANNGANWKLSLSVGDDMVISLSSLSGYYTEYSGLFVARNAVDSLHISGRAPIFLDDISVVALDAPTSQPSIQPSTRPSRQPSRQPSSQPTNQPTRQPSRQPSTQPSGQPSTQPTSQPIRSPTHPTPFPTPFPTRLESEVHSLDLNTLSAAQGFSINGTGLTLVGYTASGIGDFNKDGYDDIIIGAWNSGICISYVIFGKSSGFGDIDLYSLVYPSGIKIYGGSPNGCSGYPVGHAGDINGDGYSDVIVGIWNANYGYNAAYVVYGSTSHNDVDLDSLNGTHGFSIKGSVDYNAFIGYSVSGAGDVNGDGYDDAIIGSWNSIHPGTSYVIFGNSSLKNIYIPSLNSAQGYSISNANAAGQTGTSVSGAGDINNDGYDDIILGGAGSAENNAGCSWVIFGNKTWTDINLNNFNLSQGFSIVGASFDQSGFSVSGAGDVNGDGYDDVIIGAHGAASGKGISYILFGKSANTDVLLSNLQLPYGFSITGAMTNEHSGNSVKGVGDVNGDGFDDVIIGTYNPVGYLGYIVFGQGSLTSSILELASLTASRGFLIIGDSEGSVIVSNAGDINGDGYKDFLLGIYGHHANKGIGYVLLGNSYQSDFPTSQPSSKPSKQPSRQPSCQPNAQPTSQPSCQPTAQPSSHPSTQPSSVPTRQPVGLPTVQPSRQPTSQPSHQPSTQPSVSPTLVPSSQPTVQPSEVPSSYPSVQPSNQPSSQPTSQPSCQPRVLPTAQPFNQPSRAPSTQPSSHPTVVPSSLPTGPPSSAPSTKPSTLPSVRPSEIPSSKPSRQPSTQPNGYPSSQPSGIPSRSPSTRPSVQPSDQPSRRPSRQPSRKPSRQPSGTPSSCPSTKPSSRPSSQPRCCPTRQPSARPSSQPSTQPSVVPSVIPSRQPTSCPSCLPSVQPTVSPSRQPTCIPTSHPSYLPTSIPTENDYSSTHAALPGSMLSVIGSTDFKIILPFGKVVQSSGTAFSDIHIPVSGSIGSSFVFLGGPSVRLASLSSMSSQVHSYSTLTVGLDTSSRSVSVVGDVNGDGYNDVVIGDPFFAKCYVVFGNSMGLKNMTRGFTIFGEQSSDLTGWSVSGAGDFNNDSMADIVIGAPNCKGGVGSFYVIYGRRTQLSFDVYLNNLNMSEGFSVYGAVKGDYLGLSVNAAGDVNKDGVEDVVVGAAQTIALNAGAVYVLYGGRNAGSLSINQVDVSQGFKISGSSYQFVGSSVSGAGDVNKDGYFDLIIGSSPTKASLVPASYIIYGSATLTNIMLSALTPDLGFRIARAGTVVSSAGDLNHDYYDDVLICSVPNGLSSGLIIYTNVSDFTEDSAAPSINPTAISSLIPSIFPSVRPSRAPSLLPTLKPSRIPTVRMTGVPTVDSDVALGSDIPTYEPTIEPSEPPTAKPSAEPSEGPTRKPTVSPSVEPSLEPTYSPSSEPSVILTPIPSTSAPTEQDQSRAPFSIPTLLPSAQGTSPPLVTFVIDGHTPEYNDSESSLSTNYFVNATGNTEIDPSHGKCIYSIVPVPRVTLTILRFNASSDQIDLSQFTDIHQYSDLVITAGSVIITLSDGQVVHIMNQVPAAMSSNNFIFGSPIADTSNKLAVALTVVAIVIPISVVLGILLYLYGLQKKSRQRALAAISSHRQFIGQYETDDRGEYIFNDERDGSEKETMNTNDINGDSNDADINLSDHTLDSNGEWRVKDELLFPLVEYEQDNTAVNTFDEYGTHHDGVAHYYNYHQDYSPPYDQYSFDANNYYADFNEPETHELPGGWIAEDIETNICTEYQNNFESYDYGDKAYEDS